MENLTATGFDLAKQSENTNFYKIYNAFYSTMTRNNV